MARLLSTSNFLTARHLPEVLYKLKEAGVSIKGRKLRGYRFFNAVRGQNSLQVAFLNLSLPIVVTKILSKYGCNLHKDFESNNVHAQTTFLSTREFNKLEEWQKEIVRKLGEEILEVEIKGIIAIPSELDICLGLEIEVPGNKELMEKLKYRPTVTTHITTSHMRKEDYHHYLELTVFNNTGLRDEYLCFPPEEIQKQIRPVQIKNEHGKTIQKAVQEKAVHKKAVYEKAVQEKTVHKKAIHEKVVRVEVS